MHTLRIRPFMYFAMGIAVTAVATWSMSAWRASAAVGADESTFVNVSPTRILDTRENIGLDGPFVSADPQDLRVTGAIATKSGTMVVVPEGATGVMLNVTAVGPTADGFVSIRPADAPGVPTTSSLNFKAGDIIPNSVTVQVPTSGPDVGKIEITYNAFEQPGPTTEILVDLVGYTKNAGLASLQAQVNDLQTQVTQLTATGSAGLANLQTQINVLNAAGANVVFDTDPAGGDLTGTYPNPNLAAGSVGTSEIVDHTVGLAEMNATVQDNKPIDAPNILDGQCANVVDTNATDVAAESRVVPFGSRLTGGLPNTEFVIAGLPTTVGGQATIQVCNFTGGDRDPPPLLVSYITLGP